MTSVGHSSKCTRVAVDTTYTYTFPTLTQDRMSVGWIRVLGPTLTCPLGQ
jgi:hypothetical protein